MFICGSIVEIITKFCFSMFLEVPGWWLFFFFYFVIFCSCHQNLKQWNLTSSVSEIRMPARPSLPASHKCFMWCWYGNHRMSTMTPCESWITMAVFQAYVTLDSVQQLRHSPKIVSVCLTHTKKPPTAEIKFPIRWLEKHVQMFIRHHEAIGVKTKTSFWLKFTFCFVRAAGGSRCPVVAQTQLEDVADWCSGWHTNRARGAFTVGWKRLASLPRTQSSESSSCMSTHSHS